MGITKCEECDKDANLLDGMGAGWCFEHVIDYAQEELEKQEKEEQTGVSELDVTIRAGEKRISFADARKELEKEMKK